MNLEKNKEDSICDIVKKSDITARKPMEYKKICYQREYFIPCKLEEENEELTIQYDIAYLTAMEKIREEMLTNILAVLLNTADLFLLGQEYEFSLSPDNLYYDHNFRVKIKRRDIRKEKELLDEKDFLTQYKALIGYALQKKYTYQDYIEGGLEILNKTQELQEIYTASDIEQIRQILNEKYNSMQQKLQNEMTIVSKKSVKKGRNYKVCSSILIIGLILYIAYLNINIIPLQRAYIKANNFYTEMDYIGVIDSLENMEIDKLSQNAKYILAVSYIKSENLNTEQKTNILSTLTITSDERLFAYWISIGRLDTAEAINIALQTGDDELLLYAYLKEKSALESNNTLSGEEKIEKIEVIEGKINNLSEKYESE